MPHVLYLPLVCPTCGGILQLVDGVYGCALRHRYTAHQLDAALVEQLRQTLQRTSQQVEQRQYLAALLTQRNLLVVAPHETALLEQAHRLTEQLLTQVTRTKP